MRRIVWFIHLVEWTKNEKYVEYQLINMILDFRIDRKCSLIIKQMHLKRSSECCVSIGHVQSQLKNYNRFARSFYCISNICRITFSLKLIDTIVYYIVLCLWRIAHDKLRNYF